MYQNIIIYYIICVRERIKYVSEILNGAKSNVKTSVGGYVITEDL